MKKVTILPILIFSLLMSLPIGSTLLFTWMFDTLTQSIFLGNFILCVCSVFFFLTTLTLIYRLFLKKFPLPEGKIVVGSSVEFYYMIYLLFWLIFYTPIFRMSFIPAPLSRLALIALGAKVGEGSYSAGLVFDPHFVTIGKNTILGMDALLVPHVLVSGEDAANYPIRIGNNVTIGGRSVVMAGCTIDDGAVVGFCSLVTRGTHIGPNEVWAGIPAKYIKTLEQQKA